MKLRLTPPGVNTSFENERASEPTSGKIDRPRMNSTAGQMKTQRAAPSERHAPSGLATRRVAEEMDGSVWVDGPPSEIWIELPLDAKTRHVGGQLGVLAASRRVRDLVPAVRDGLFGRRLVLLTGEVRRDLAVEDVLLVLLGQRDPQVQHHVRALEAVLDGAE